jgi:hypothetical protein
MLHICGVSKNFGEWYQDTNQIEDTNKLTLLAFKIIVILHNTRLATFIKFLETVSKGLFRNRSQNSCHTYASPTSQHISLLICQKPIYYVMFLNNSILINSYMFSL